MTACIALPALAASEDPDPAQPERVWGGCVLGSNQDVNPPPDEPIDTVQGLIDDMVASGLPATSEAPEVAFVVIYSLKDNDGQGQVTALGKTGFTGAIVCINDAVVVDIFGVEPTDDIPADTGPEDADSIDILDLEEAMVLRYEVNGGDTNGAVEKRFCHTTGVNNDCFRIVGPPPPPPEP